MILHCERRDAGWACRAGWNLALNESADSPAAAFLRLCVALALDPAAFRVVAAGDRPDVVLLAAGRPDAALDLPAPSWPVFPEPADPPAGPSLRSAAATAARRHARSARAALRRLFGMAS